MTGSDGGSSLPVPRQRTGTAAAERRCARGVELPGEPHPVTTLIPDPAAATKAPAA